MIRSVVVNAQLAIQLDHEICEVRHIFVIENCGKVKFILRPVWPFQHFYMNQFLLPDHLSFNS